MVNELKQVESRWREFGTHLGIDLHKLRSTAEEKTDNDCLIDVIDLWWNKQQESPDYCLSDIYEALRNIEEGRLAKELSDFFDGLLNFENLFMFFIIIGFCKPHRQVVQTDGNVDIDCDLSAQMNDMSIRTRSGNSLTQHKYTVLFVSLESTDSDSQSILEQEFLTDRFQQISSPRGILDNTKFSCHNYQICPKMVHLFKLQFICSSTPGQCQLQQKRIKLVMYFPELVMYTKHPMKKHIINIFYFVCKINLLNLTTPMGGWTRNMAGPSKGKHFHHRYSMSLTRY